MVNHVIFINIYIFRILPYFPNENYHLRKSAFSDIRPNGGYQTAGSSAGNAGMIHETGEWFVLT